jgi:hypothetical protein
VAFAPSGPFARYKQSLPVPHGISVRTIPRGSEVPNITYLPYLAQFMIVLKWDTATPNMFTASIVFFPSLVLSDFCAMPVRHKSQCRWPSQAVVDWTASTNNGSGRFGKQTSRPRQRDRTSECPLAPLRSGDERTERHNTRPNL